MKEFAATAYKQFAYINFEDNEVMKEVFQKDFDIERILMAIQLVTGKVVDTDTLILFDELQEAPRGLTAMKYFLEKAPQYHVIAAGSLLGIAMHQNDSFPVGKVDFIDLYPLSFSEFLEAIGQESFVSLLVKQDWNLISTFRSKFTDFLKQYYFVGGMPEVVNAFIEHKAYTESASCNKTYWILMTVIFPNTLLLPKSLGFVWCGVRFLHNWLKKIANSFMEL